MGNLRTMHYFNFVLLFLTYGLIWPFSSNVVGSNFRPHIYTLNQGNNYYNSDIRATHCNPFTFVYTYKIYSFTRMEFMYNTHSKKTWFAPKKCSIPQQQQKKRVTSKKYELHIHIIHIFLLSMAYVITRAITKAWSTCGSTTNVSTSSPNATPPAVCFPITCTFIKNYLNLAPTTINLRLKFTHN